MRKYWVILCVSLSERLVYRADFFLATFLRFIPIITTILLWEAIFHGAGKEEVGGLNYSQMVAYYLFIMVNRAFGSMPGLSTDISGDIRGGDLRKYLLQPIDYLTYQMTLRTAHKLVYMVMAAAPYALVFWMCRSYLPPWPILESIGPAAATLVLSFFLGFSMNALVGVVGFWFLEVGSFIHLFMTAQYFLSGHMFPLGLLPDSIHRWVTYLPFAYEAYYPTLILLGKLDSAEITRVLVTQAVWVVVLLTLLRIAWLRGLRRYAAFGG